MQKSDDTQDNTVLIRFRRVVKKERTYEVIVSNNQMMQGLIVCIGSYKDCETIALAYQSIGYKFTSIHTTNIENIAEFIDNNSDHVYIYQIFEGSNRKLLGKYKFNIDITDYRIVQIHCNSFSLHDYIDFKFDNNTQCIVKSSNEVVVFYQNQQYLIEF